MRSNHISQSPNALIFPTHETLYFPDEDIFRPMRNSLSKSVFLDQPEHAEASWSHLFELESPSCWPCTRKRSRSQRRELYENRHL